MCERVWRHLVQKIVTLKIVYNKKKIQIFVMNIPFISSREASQLMKYALFASLNEINGIFIPKNWISSIYFILSSEINAYQKQIKVI